MTAMNTIEAVASTAHVQYVLRIADSSLILGQRLSEWCGHGPVIEEDIALTNVALDLIGQARLLLTHAGRLEGAGRDEDASTTVCMKSWSVATFTLCSEHISQRYWLMALHALALWIAFLICNSLIWS